MNLCPVLQSSRVFHRFLLSHHPQSRCYYCTWVAQVARATVLRATHGGVISCRDFYSSSIRSISLPHSSTSVITQLADRVMSTLQPTTESDRISTLPLTQVEMVSRQRHYITEESKFNHFDIFGKLVMSFSCGGEGCDSGGGQKRVISERCLHEGSVVVRCSVCNALNVLSDHKQLFTSHIDSSNINDIISYSLHTHRVMRLDKDTIELLPNTCADMDEVLLEVDDAVRKQLEDLSSNIVITKCYVVLVDAASLHNLWCEHQALLECKPKIPEYLSEHDWISVTSKENLHQKILYYRYIERLHRMRDKELRQRQLHMTGEAPDMLVPAVVSQPVNPEKSHRPHILYDMGYESTMSLGEIRETASQLIKGASWNSEQGDLAMRITFTNVEQDGRLYRELYRNGLEKFVQQNDNDTESGERPGSVSITASLPIEMYALDKLVLLSPDADDYVPDKYDGESIYVISSIVDKIGDFSDQYLYNMYRSTLRAGYQFGTRFIYDLGYGTYMNYHEKQLCVHQLAKAFAWNRAQCDAAHLTLTNIEKDGHLHWLIHNRAGGFGNPEGGDMLREDSFLDLTTLPPEEVYPLDKLIFLSPDANEPVGDTYDGHSIYVISSIVDIGWEKPLTYETAQRLGARCQSLPIDKYVVNASSKWELPVHAVLQILMTWMRNGGDWGDAFKYLPHHTHTKGENERAVILSRQEVAKLKQAKKKNKRWLNPRAVKRVIANKLAAQ